MLRNRGNADATSSMLDFTGFEAKHVKHATFQNSFSTSG
jgi:hypothetical protein